MENITNLKLHKINRMNIIEAVKLIKEGKKVRRLPEWKPYERQKPYYLTSDSKNNVIDINDDVILFNENFKDGKSPHSEYDGTLNIADFLSKDWEVVE